MTRVLAVAVLLVTAASASADPNRVALVDTDRMFDKAGVAVWAAARAKLDAEEPKFVVVESSSGQNVNAHTDISDPKMRKIFTDMDRDAERNKAWEAHVREVLDPIENDVLRALDAYARAHGIGIVLDRGKIGDAILVAAPGADITDAFIKDYNAAAASHARKPASANTVK